MHVIEIIKLIIYFVLLFICAWTDYKKGKIYNKNLLKFILIYTILYVFEYAIVFFTDKQKINQLNEDLLNNLIGFVIAFALGFIFYILGVLKGGDAKLLSIVGLCVGGKEVFIHFAIIILVAGVASLYVLIKNKIFIKRFRRIGLYFKGMFLTRKYERYTTDDDGIKFPFAVYILIGEVLSYVYCLLK